jgi:choline/ethanolamine phosphotransferase
MNRLKPLNKQLENKINSMAPIISTAQLKHLSEHKYTSQGTSLLEPYFQPFWCYVVEQIPVTLAPNLITIIGLIINVFTCMIMFLHSPTGLDYIPGWVCMLCAIGLFVYQTLDAIDGKQARRTQSSSPLGELFDHGCDAVSTVFVTIALCLSARINTVHPWAMLCMCVFAMGAFYVAHWQTYVTGVLRFGKCV